jgi:hypothetical protein
MGEYIASIIRVGKIGELGTLEVSITCSVFQLLVTAKVPSMLIISTLMMEAIRSPETSVLTSVTRRHPSIMK